MRRSSVVFATAVAATVALKLGLPLPADDPFRGTLAILPLVVAAFLQIGRWARAHGGPETSSSAALVEGATLGFLVLLVFGRSHLGLRYGEVLVSGLLAAGFVLVLAHRVTRLALALRPSLGPALPRRPPAVFFFLPLTVYLAILPWSNTQRPPDGDEPYYLLLAHSLAYDFDTDLRNNYEAGDSVTILGRRIAPQSGDPIGEQGEQFSRHNALLPLILAPAYRVGGTFGALVLMAVFSAALAWSFLRLARRYWADRPGSSLAAYSIVAFTAPLLLYSHQAWVEVPAALLLTLAVDRILELREQGRAAAGVRGWVWLGVLVLLLPLLKLRFIVLAVGLLLLVAVSLRLRLRVLALGATVIATLSAGLLGYNWLRFGTALKTRSWDALRLYEIPPLDFLEGGLGLFFDSGIGLFAFAPIWGLLLVSVLSMTRSRQWALLLHAALVLGPYLLFVVSASSWFGAWSPPFRYAMVGLPILGVALVPALERRAGGTGLLVSSLGLLTLALTLLWIVVPGWTYNLPDGTSHLLDHMSRLTGTDIGRVFPSYIRPRTASWVWPLAAAIVAALAWRSRRPTWTRSVTLGGPLLLAAVAAVLFAARSAPTRIIEIEDVQVAKRGGQLYPEPWELSRQLHRGGWTVSHGDRIEAPVVTGGAAVRLVLDLQTGCRGPDRIALRITAGEQELTTAEFPCRSAWRTVDLGTRTWPPGVEQLTIEMISPEGFRATLDRVHLEWE